MGVWRFDSYSSLIIFSVAALFCLVGLFSSGVLYQHVGGSPVIVGGMFIVDTVSFYLILLSGLLWCSLLFFLPSLTHLGRVCLFSSLSFSILCYCCAHAVWFWVFYEMAILPLLLLLIVESPYSERYIAAWYLLGYVVLTSLPMLLCIFYFSLEFGSFFISSWEKSAGVGVYILLGVMFITKIPLPPFHVWLPIVHAEASSPVSVCLSGYIMKLGILGVCRFCSILLPSHIFSGYYMLIVLCGAVLFFFSASRELDGKRWLAFLSLSHILIASLCLCVSRFDLSSASFIYCLGHGASAGVIFILLWALYDVSGSRNWGILKYSVSSSLVVRVLSGACLCTAASLPPTLQFFSEVFVVQEAVLTGSCYLVGLCGYLFMGGLVPMFLFGSLLTRHYSISFGVGRAYVFLCSILFLILCSFVLFVLV